MPSLYLIRHGQASFGQQNYDKLSELGEQQATRLGEALSERVGGFDQVCLGGMFRHRQTAENCLNAMSDPQANRQDDWHLDPGWNEYDHQDILAQLGSEFESPEGIQAFVMRQDNPKKAFEKLFNDAMNRWMSGDHDNEYVESWEHYQTRIKGALSKAVERHKDAKKIAVFSSGGPISVISQYLLGVPADRIMQLNWTLLNCGVTKLVSTGNRLFVASLNDHAHFEGPHQSLISYK